MCCKMIQAIVVNLPGDNPGTWTDFIDAISGKGFPSLAVLKRLVIDCSKIEFLPGGMEWNDWTYNHGGFDSRLGDSLVSFFRQSPATSKKIEEVKLMVYGYRAEGQGDRTKHFEQFEEGQAGTKTSPMTIPRGGLRSCRGAQRRKQAPLGPSSPPRSRQT